MEKKLIILLVLLSGCFPTEEERRAGSHKWRKEQMSNKTSVIHYRGMPCLVMSGWTTLSGITCDWSKYKGEEWKRN